MNLHDVEAVASGVHRRAALALLALAPEDRTWLLDRLPKAKREMLNALLDELQMLGIAVDPTLMRTLIDESQILPMETLRDVCDRAGPVRLAALLDREPAALAVLVMQSQDESGRRALLEALAPTRRRQIDEAWRARRSAADLPVAIALQSKLRDLLAARLAGCDSDDRTARRAPISTLSRLRVALRAVFGGHGGWR